MHNTCRDIMHSHIATLRPEQTLHEALTLIHRNHVRYMPVVDEHGDFVGMFSTVILLERLLPQSVSIKMGSQMSDLNFMKTGIEELQERLDAHGDEPVSQHMQTEDLHTCHPDDSVMEAIFILHEYRTHVVITPKDSQKFLGIITINALLDCLQPQTST